MLKPAFTATFILLLSAVATAQINVKPTPQWRPVYHFSPPKNWTNDPNGLIFLNGKYNLYYQHNPFANQWGHMSWGHAVSTNLVNWTNLPVAMPELISNDTVTMMFSGCAVLDKDNTSGFGTRARPPLVAVYTADLPNQHKEVQHLAYSNDGGISFKQYAGNPIIDLNKKDFRDPNVFWYEPAKQWIMTVAMVNEHMVRIYGSRNLKDWNRLSDFGPAGYTKNGWECPSLLPLTVEGSPAKTKWVMLVSCPGDHGPLMQYFTGDFDGTTFHNDNPADQVLKVDYGDAFYAAIAWRDAPGNKKILLGWLQNGRPETYPWKGQMSIPRDLALRTMPDGLRLVQKPSTVATSALLKRAANVVKRDIALTDAVLPLPPTGRLRGNAYWIDAELKVNGAKRAGFVLAENKASGKKVTVGYDAVNQQLFIDCTASEKENKDAANLVQIAPLKPLNGTIKIQVLLDRSSLEVIGNDGEKVISTMIYPDTGATGLSFFAAGRAELSSLKMWDLDKK